LIVTITPNPAIDQIYWVDKIRDAPNTLLTRASQTLACAGGKGINVSILLSALGVETITMGFVAGYMGHAIEHFLHGKKITTNFVWTDGETRTNVIVIEKDREVHPVEVNGLGPTVSATANAWFLKRYTTALKRTDRVMLGGSLPPGLPADFYRSLIRQAHDSKTKVALYCSGDAFTAACQEGPWISKPDLRERSMVLGKPVNTADELYAAGRELLATGSEIVILAHDLQDPVAHQLVLTRDGAWSYAAQSAKLCNRVGAGDAFLGGFLYKLQRGQTPQEAGRYGMAASIACTETRSIMVSSRNAIETALRRVKEESL